MYNSVLLLFRLLIVKFQMALRVWSFALCTVEICLYFFFIRAYAARKHKKNQENSVLKIVLYPIDSIWNKMQSKWRNY